MRATVRMEAGSGPQSAEVRVWLDDVEVTDVRSLRLIGEAVSVVELQLTLLLSGVDVEGEAAVEIVKDVRCPACKGQRGRQQHETMMRCEQCNLEWVEMGEVRNDP